MPPPAKHLWCWLVDKCDHAGVIEADFGLASFQIGEKVDSGTLVCLGDRVRRLKGGKLWLPKFIEFQYGELSEKCPAHKPVFKAIERHGLGEFVKGKAYPNGRVSNTLQDKDTEKDKDLCTLEQAKDYGTMVRLTPEEAEFWWHTRKKAGWTISSAAGAARKITSWQSDMATAVEWVKERATKRKGGSRPGSNLGDSTSLEGL